MCMCLCVGVGVGVMCECTCACMCVRVYASACECVFVSVGVHVTWSCLCEGVGVCAPIHRSPAYLLVLYRLLASLPCAAAGLPIGRTSRSILVSWLCLMSCSGRSIPLTSPSFFPCAHRSDLCFCIDGLYSGNMARFMNHSCVPNLVVVP